MSLFLAPCASPSVLYGAHIGLLALSSARFSSSAASCCARDEPRDERHALGCACLVALLSCNAFRRVYQALVPSQDHADIRASFLLLEPTAQQPAVPQPTAQQSTATPAVSGRCGGNMAATRGETRGSPARQQPHPRARGKQRRPRPLPQARRWAQWRRRRGRSRACGNASSSSSCRLERQRRH